MSRWFESSYRLSYFCSECGKNSEQYAYVAQLVERLICNQQVVGSSPTFGSTVL